MRLLPFETCSGAKNMAADEVLLAAAQEGLASLRLYAWSEATVSLGYFQPAATHAANPRIANLPWVRRSTGGEMLVHHHELTYALALPAHLVGKKPADWMRRMHEILAKILNDQKPRSPATLAEDEQRFGPGLCFLHHTPGDLIVENAKVVGSAQRKQRGCLLQHGGILLRQSEATPELPGLFELTGLELDALGLAELVIAACADWGLEPAHWNQQELSDVSLLAEEKYGDPAWNEKR